MFTIYLIALIGVATIIFAVMLDAVISVSRPTKWAGQPSILSVVQTTDRRAAELAFVGNERRDAGNAVPEEVAEAQAA